jgi:quercetin dioxygenase-like cupin family protein
VARCSGSADDNEEERMTEGVRVESWDRLQSVTVFDGVDIRLLDGAGMTLVRARCSAGASVPAHQHPHEQMTWVISGSLRMTVDGVVSTVDAGEVIRVPGDVEHESFAPEDTEILEVFTPRRDDLADRVSAANR